MASSSILARKTAWTETPGGLQSVGSQKSQTRLTTHALEPTQDSRQKAKFEKKMKAM